MRKFILILAIIIICIAGYYGVQHFKTPTVNDYSDLLKENASQPVQSPVSSSGSVALATITLNDMLQQGISTDGGILKSTQDNNTLKPYYLELDSKPLKIRAVSPISLVKAFLVESNQVLLFSYNQGGNQCDYQYQFLTITPQKHYTSEIFGSCLKITEINAGESSILLSMPRNNPYLGDDVTVSYLYQNGMVRRQEINLKGQLKQKYADYTAAQILQLAATDGCYEDGVLLMDNSCANGKKYCVIFRHLQKPKKDAAYKTLKEFCTQ